MQKTSKLLKQVVLQPEQGNITKTPFWTMNLTAKTISVTRVDHGQKLINQSKKKCDGRQLYTPHE